LSLPAEVRERFETADKLSDEDRETIIELARQALVPFQPQLEVNADKPVQESGEPPGPTRTAESILKPKPDARGETEAPQTETLGES
jgi:F-type H+-transporting ATPase subunit alpha